MSTDIYHIASLRTIESLAEKASTLWCTRSGAEAIAVINSIAIYSKTMRMALEGSLPPSIQPPAPADGAQGSAEGEGKS